MSLLVFLFGLFAVPLGMLLSCHRFKRRTRRQRRMLWGMVAGYGVSLLVVLLVSLVPPVMWMPATGLRSFLVHWSLALLPALGVLIAFVTNPRADGGQST